MVTNQDYFLLIMIMGGIELKPKIFMKSLVKMKNVLILVNIQLSQSIIMIQTNQLLVR